MPFSGENAKAVINQKPLDQFFQIGLIFPKIKICSYKHM